MKTLEQVRDELVEAAYDKASDRGWMNEELEGTVCSPLTCEEIVRESLDALLAYLSESAGELENVAELAPHYCASVVQSGKARLTCIEDGLRLGYIDGRKTQFEQDRARIGLAEQSTKDARHAFAVLDEHHLKIKSELTARCEKAERELAEYKSWMPTEPKPSERKLSSEVNRLIGECNRLQNLLDKARLAVDQSEKRAENKLAAAEAELGELKAFHYDKRMEQEHLKQTAENIKLKERVRELEAALDLAKTMAPNLRKR